MAAATSATCRASSDKWASRAATTAWTRGDRTPPLAPVCSLLPCSMTNSGWPSVCWNRRLRASRSNARPATSSASRAVAVSSRRPSTMRVSRSRRSISFTSAPRAPVLLVFASPECRNDQAAERRVGAEEVMQPFQRVGVRPLDVVRDEDQRSRRLKGVRESARRRGSAARVPGSDLPRPGWRIGISSGHSRATSRRPAGSSEASGRSDRVTLQPGRDRRVAQSAFARIALRQGDAPSVPVAPVHELLGQSRLADAGLAANDQQVRAALVGTLRAPTLPPTIRRHARRAGRRRRADGATGIPGASSASSRISR